MQMGKLKPANTLEMANHTAKRSEIWDSWAVELAWGTLDLIVFKVTLGHSVFIFPKIFQLYL